MNVEEAYEIIRAKSTLNPGNFYQVGDRLSLGVGKLYSGIRYPHFNLEDQLFDTFEGIVFVLSHECDIAEENQRPFSDQLIFCPVISFQDLIAEYSHNIGNDEVLTSFLSNVAVNNVSRVFYLPSCGDDIPYGGFMYLNQISNTHRSAFPADPAQSFAAVTAPGLRVIDMCLTNHLLRPKSEALALSR